MATAPMDAGRFADFWRELRQELGGRTEWSRRVAAADGGGEYMVMLHILPAPATEDGGGGGGAVGGRLAVLGGTAAAAAAAAAGADGGDGGGSTGHGLWALDIDAKALTDFEEKVLEYTDVKVFAQEFAQVLQAGQQQQAPGANPESASPPDKPLPATAMRVVLPPPPQQRGGQAWVKVQLDFRPLQDSAAAFTLRPLQTHLSPTVLATLLPFFNLDRRGFGRHPLPLAPEAAAGDGEARAGAGASKKAKKRKAGGGYSGRKNEVY